MRTYLTSFTPICHIVTPFMQYALGTHVPTNVFRSINVRLLFIIWFRVTHVYVHVADKVISLWYTFMLILILLRWGNPPWVWVNFCSKDYFHKVFRCFFVQIQCDFYKEFQMSFRDVTQVERISHWLADEEILRFLQLPLRFQRFGIPCFEVAIWLKDC